MAPLDQIGEKILAHYVAHGSKDQSAAWLHAHPESKAKPRSVNVSASRFFAQANVQLRLAELHAEIVKASVKATALTVEEHDEKLVELRELALLQGKVNVALSAEVKRGELRGFYVNRTEHGEAGDFDRMSVEELRAYVLQGIVADETDTKH